MNMMNMKWPIGVECELLAPIGLSRLDLANTIASNHAGSVSMFWHPQVEPSLVPGMKVFHNLTPGFRIVSKEGKHLGDCVGDLTITQQLNRTHPSKEGWFRILSDDLRLLHLIARHASTDRTNLPMILHPIADLFGTNLHHLGNVVRVEGAYQHPVALGAGLPGERERVTEVVSGIITTDYEQHLEDLLRPARMLGFTIPLESATHIHFDGSPFENPISFANLAELLNRYRLPLRFLFRTNPNCIRLGTWPEEFLPFLRSDDFSGLTWEEAQIALRDIGLSKFCDCNLRNLVFNTLGKQTIEIRILPGIIESKPILVAAQIIECILQKALSTKRLAPCQTLTEDATSVHTMFSEIEWTVPSTEIVFGHESFESP